MTEQQQNTDRPAADWHFKGIYAGKLHLGIRLAVFKYRAQT
jgi:hypothetical protein